MGFELEDVVPWGRSFDEYVAMFMLTDEDRQGRILGCGDGPASFNAEATRCGARVTSIDPIYAFTRDEIDGRIETTSAEIADQLRSNVDAFVWTHFQSVDDVIDARMKAMRRFVDDYADGMAAGRYVPGELPHLPFENDAFDLALCSHFLFLYGARLDAVFHLEAALELLRVAREVRIFPIIELDGVPSRHLDDVSRELDARGFRVERARSRYEFQKGGNEMLRIRRPNMATSVHEKR